MRILAVDDSAPALHELRRMLLAAPGVSEVATACDAVSALRLLRERAFDAAFLDIALPVMDGMELAGVLARMAEPPAVVFVTAFDEHAASAYDLGAVDYLQKPVGAERLAAALDRVRRFTAQPDLGPKVDALAAIPVEQDGRTRFVRRADVRFAEAHGDYVRLHVPGAVHLLRIPISRLEEHWRDAGFARVHRGFLLAVARVRELRSDVTGGLLAHTDVGDVPVSRRHARDLRELLLDAATRGAFE